jgi:hypothetical protein
VVRDAAIHCLVEARNSTAGERMPRFWPTPSTATTGLLSLSTDDDPIGARTSVRSFDYGNRAVLA